MVTKIREPETLTRQSSRTRIIISIAAGGLTSAGAVLRAQDEDDEGTDDAVGVVLEQGAKALQAYALGQTNNFRRTLRLIADSLNSYLEETEV